LTQDLLSVIGQHSYDQEFRVPVPAPDVPGLEHVAASGCVELSPMTLQLVLILRDAFLALRRRAVPIVAVYGSFMVSRGPVCW
jgi:hypothetical protein